MRRNVKDSGPVVVPWVHGWFSPNQGGTSHERFSPKKEKETPPPFAKNKPQKYTPTIFGKQAPAYYGVFVCVLGHPFQLGLKPSQK